MISLTQNLVATGFGDDAVDRKSRELDPLGNQRILTSYPDATTVAVTYDDVGNRTAVDDAIGHWAWTYNALGLATSELTPMAASPTQYQYDNEAHRTRLIDPDANQIITEYDAAYGVSAVRFNLGPQLQTISYQRDPRGLVTVRTLPNGVRSTYDYDLLGHRTLIEHRRADTTLLFRLTYQYDAAGNPTRETSLRWDIGLGTTVPYETQYRYNARHKLTGDKYFKNGAFILDLDYSYDPAGNRMRKVTTDPTTPNSPVTIDSTYRADNQIATAVRTAPLDPPQTTTYSEDANGNVTQEAAPTGTTSYSYNFENKLRRVDLFAGTSLTFRSSFDGLRIERTTPAGPVRQYFLDAVQALLEKDASGTTQARYVPGLARIVGSEVRYYLEERLGSVAALLDASQSITQAFRHDAWGTLLEQQGTGSAPYQWVGVEGYYLNPEFGLYLLGLRHYSPALGRFLTRDPLGLQRKDWHQYRYTHNNPLVFIDPTGEFPWLWAACAACLLVAAGYCTWDCWNHANFWACMEDCIIDKAPLCVFTICALAAWRTLLRLILKPPAGRPPVGGRPGPRAPIVLCSSR